MFEEIESTPTIIPVSWKNAVFEGVMSLVMSRLASCADSLWARRLILPLWEECVDGP